MDKKYQYREIKTNEVVEDFMTEYYVLNKLGITVEPKRKEWNINTRATRVFR